MSLAKHNDMIEQLSPKRTNQPFSIAVLPRRPRRRRSDANAHCAKPPKEDRAIDAVTITNDICRRFLPAAGLSQLASKPFSRRVCCHSQPHDLASMVTQDQKSIEQPEGNDRHHKEIDRDNALRVIEKKSPPAL